MTPMKQQSLNNNEKNTYLSIPKDININTGIGVCSSDNSKISIKIRNETLDCEAAKFTNYKVISLIIIENIEVSIIFFDSASTVKATSDTKRPHIWAYSADMWWVWYCNLQHWSIVYSYLYAILK